MHDDIQEKTENATYQHIKKAKSEGIRYYSDELNSLLVFCSVMIFGYFYINNIIFIFSQVMVLGLSFNHSIINHGYLYNTMMFEVKKIFFLFLLFFLIYIFFILITSIIFNGFLLNLNFMKMDNLYFNGFYILKNIFSYIFYVKYFNVFFKCLIFFLIVILYLRYFFFIIINLSFLPMYTSLKTGFQMILYFIIFMFVGFIPIVVIDIVWNKFNYDNNLKMSRQEIKDEQKDNESKSNVYESNINNKK